MTEAWVRAVRTSDSACEAIPLHVSAADWLPCSWHRTPHGRGGGDPAGPLTRAGARGQETGRIRREAPPRTSNVRSVASIARAGAPDTRF